MGLEKSGANKTKNIKNDGYAGETSTTFQPAAGQIVTKTVTIPAGVIDGIKIEGSTGDGGAAYLNKLEVRGTSNQSWSTVNSVQTDIRGTIEVSFTHQSVAEVRITIECGSDAGRDVTTVASGRYGHIHEI
jgi:hypothetical protein